MVFQCLFVAVASLFITANTTVMLCLCTAQILICEVFLFSIPSKRKERNRKEKRQASVPTAGWPSGDGRSSGGEEDLDEQREKGAAVMRDAHFKQKGIYNLRSEPVLAFCLGAVTPQSADTEGAGRQLLLMHTADTSITQSLKFGPARFRLCSRWCLCIPL